MCDPATFTALFTGAGAGATGAGATAVASTAATLQKIGLALSIGGTAVQGVQTYAAAKANVAAIRQQKADDAVLTAIEDQRTRAQFRSAMRRQSAELIARGIDPGSPSAIVLGQVAGQELSAASQDVRSKGAARRTQLSNEARQMQSRGMSGLLNGTFTAADKFLTAAPDIWPELLR